MTALQTIFLETPPSGKMAAVNWLVFSNRRRNRMSNSSPVDEIPEGNASPTGFPKHWIALGLLVLAHAALGAYFTPIGKRAVEDETGAFLMIGVLASQPILFAIWAAFAPQRFYHRFLWSLLLCALVSYAAELGALRNTSHGLGGLLVLDIALFIAATIILLLFRRYSRWQIKQPNREDAPSIYQANQFGIKHLLILTTITALVCGLYRTLYIIAPDLKRFSSITEFMGALCLMLALLFPVIVIPWYTLAYRRRLLSLIGITIIIAGILDLAACSLLIEMNAPVSRYDLIIKPYLLIQLGSAMSAFASTLVIRWCGFRMIREPRSQKQT